MHTERHVSYSQEYHVTYRNSVYTAFLSLLCNQKQFVLKRYDKLVNVKFSSVKCPTCKTLKREWPFKPYFFAKTDLRNDLTEEKVFFDHQNGESFEAREPLQTSDPNREKEDLKRVGFFVFLSLALGAFLLATRGQQTAVEYITAYIIEESLSVDNLFVFLLIFRYFMVPRNSQDRILFWGIVGAIGARALMIWSGAELLEHFRFMSLVFGAFLVFSGAKLLVPSNSDEEQVNIEDNRVYRWVTKVFPFTFQHGRDDSFFIRQTQNGQVKWFGTSLFLVLLIIELSDVVFALDSIPAVLGVSKDRLVIYVSNLMAILGLRSLFFVLNDAIGNLRFLKQSLSFVLGFIGVKMCMQYFGSSWDPTWSMFIVIGILGIGIFTSWYFPSKNDHTQDET
eukprot:jgi/Galph1/2491/GphlegSOOS_G1159.1